MSIKSKYIIGVAFAFFVLLINQLYIQYNITRIDDNGSIINKAGYQRMLSQQIALTVQKKTHDKQTDKTVNELISKWKKQHFNIIEQQFTKDAINEFQIQETIQELEDDIKTVENLVKVGLNSEAELNLFNQTLDHFLLNMDNTVSKLDLYAKNQIKGLKYIEIILFLISISLLIIEMLLIFKPIQSTLKKTVSDLEMQNSEKEVLLKEIHHRVKNNLQVIVSLLSLQSSKFDDQNVVDAISETQNRIISMSLVHQRMYQTVDFVAINLEEYINSLFENIELLYSTNPIIINKENNIPKEIKMDIENAIPLGLMINEMITNSFKHAFVDNGQRNVIIFDFESNSDDQYVLSYKDSGIGFPENFDIKNSGTLGVELIEALAEQINGVIDLFNADGAVFKVTFPIDLLKTKKI